MLTLAALVLAQGGRSLLQQIVPRPTGRNGYEEYLLAADLLRGPEAGVYANWRPGAAPPPKDPNDPEDPGPSKATVALYVHLNALTPLEVRREEVGRFGRALLLVAQGNAKPVFDPRGSMGTQTLFPEYASFRTVARFAARAASVYAADGQTGRATDLLLDQLIFADNISRGVIIANLVGAANQAIVLAGFNDLLPRLCRADAGRAIRTIDSLLTRPAAARTSFPAELAFAKTALREGFADKGDAAGLFYSDSEEGQKPDPRQVAFAKEFASLSPIGRRRLLATIEARLDARAVAQARVFDRPERNWVSSMAQLSDDDDSAPDLAAAIVQSISPVFSQFIVVSVRVRTQLRLLALHLSLVEYRWDYTRLPESIDSIDPLTGEKYDYEVKSDGTIRLASKGIPETGEIELRYRRPVPQEVGKP